MMVKGRVRPRPNVCTTTVESSQRPSTERESQKARMPGRVVLTAQILAPGTDNAPIRFART